MGVLILHVCLFLTETAAQPPAVEASEELREVFPTGKRKTVPEYLGTTPATDCWGDVTDVKIRSMRIEPVVLDD